MSFTRITLTAMLVMQLGGTVIVQIRKQKCERDNWGMCVLVISATYIAFEVHILLVLAFPGLDLICISLNICESQSGMRVAVIIFITLCLISGQLYYIILPKL